MALRHFLLFFIASMFLVSEAVASQVTVAPLKPKVHIGNYQDIIVRIDPQGTPIAGAQMDLRYNASSVSINSVREGNLFSQYGASTYSHNGTINDSQGSVWPVYSVIMGPYNVTTPGTFFTINITVKDGKAPASINLSSVIIASPAGTYVPYNMTIRGFSIYPRYDPNMDGRIDIFDLVFIAQHFGELANTNSDYDVNMDGVVDILDIQAVSSNMYR